MVEGVVEEFVELPAWILVGLILSGSVLVAKTLDLVTNFILHRTDRLANNGYDRLVVEELHTPLYLSVILAGIYASARVLPEVVTFFYVSATITSVVALLWAHAIIRLGKRVISMTNDSPSGREITPLLRNLMTFFGILGTVFVLLSIWQVDVTPLLASAGVIGIILGVAARDSLGNFFSGISLYLDNTYKLGDMIRLDSGERGTVIDMSIRSTTILTRNNIAITVPNAELNSTQVINESAPVRRRRIRLNVGVAYGSNLETVKHTLLDVADREGLILESPPPVIRFREFGDSAIVAQIQCFIEHPALRGRARHCLIERIDRQFREEDIKIPFPQQELTFFEAGNSISIQDGSADVDIRRDQSADTDGRSEQPADEFVERGRRN